MNNLFILQYIKPLWLRKVCANLLAFVPIYFIILYNRETAFLLTLFVSAFLYKKLKSFVATKEHSMQTLHKEEQNLYRESLLTSSIDIIIASLFCACLLSFDTWQTYIILVCVSCIFLRIYDRYKPSVIGRLYNYEKNLEFGYICGAVINGVLSALSTMLLSLIFSRFFVQYL